MQKFLPEEYRHQEPVDTMVRFSHDKCGDTKERLYVKRLYNGWMFHCHNCAPKMSGFFPQYNQEVRTPKQTIEAYGKLTEKTIVEDKELALPSDFTSFLPQKANDWLQRYDITDEETLEHCFGFSESLNRLILPVYKNDKCIFWQGRNLDVITKDNPKYLSVQAKGVDKSFIIKKERPTITIVEDILSAIKVGRYTDTIAVLGSYVPDKIMDYIRTVELSEKGVSVRNHYKLINVWLDEDKYLDAGLKIAQRLRTFGLNVRTIKTTLDPKECTDESIKSLTS